jgi:hypothetical protein
MYRLRVVWYTRIRIEGNIPDYTESHFRAPQYSYSLPCELNSLMCSVLSQDIFFMNNAVFWDVAPRKYCVNRRFGGRSVYTISIRCHIPEDGILHSHRREKPQILQFFMSKSYKITCNLFNLIGIPVDEIYV